MSGVKVEPGGRAASARSRYATASAVVTTGGTRFGIRMARPKFLAVNGNTALSMAPSRTCRCQSSGLRMVRREVMDDERSRRYWTTLPADGLLQIEHRPVDADA